jgi:hypothetical protein
MMTQELYNLLSAKSSLVAWYPFCENTHTTGYTPNVADQLNGSNLRLTLDSFASGEYCGNGIAYFMPGPAGCLIAPVSSSLQISGDYTILFNYKVIDTSGVNESQLFHCWADGETLATNVLYEAWRTNVGKIWLKHEYDAGVNVEVDTLRGISYDSSSHFYCFRRNSTLKKYQARVDNGSFSNVSYSNNANGGTVAYFRFPGQPISPREQSDGEYRNFMIFNQLLTDEEINIIHQAGYPEPDWFNYLKWNGTIGYVTWNNPSENKLYSILTNQRISPYKAGTNDKIQLKYSLYSDDKTRSSYIKNIGLELKLNYNSGVFETKASGTTDNYGNYTFYYPCSDINVNNCLGYVTTTINDKIYDSNVVRFNFA